jgi:phosphoglycerate dehydrogenase-like enzyme
MAALETFRVGLTPDWGTRTRNVLDEAVGETLASLPGLIYEWMPDTGGTATREVADNYDAIIVFGYYFPAECLNGVRRLACLARWGVGYDRIDVPACNANGVAIAITPPGVRRPVAEGIHALIFSLAKNLPALDRRVREGRWRENLTEIGICVEGRTLGSIGAGNIAGEMFRMARGIGFGRLLAFDPFVGPERAAELGIELVDLDTVMSQSDFVSINVPLSEHTQGLVDARALSLMKPTAYLVNTARGPIVDEKALTRVLRDRKIAGAGIDVFEQEPPEKDNPLFQLDNVILAPHSVAWTEESLRGNSIEACLNVRRIYEGNPPNYTANSSVLQQADFLRKLASRRRP